ncbi:hypothetical protein COCSADRAFT_292970 [Bipolaris sorokiniana ND90Pr]|uniref:Spindle pole body-associated protein cut12 domain-containing protein n=1 Tax=Cochliobolus sativus (strain ND90Pr / ATCC 201652) TaxID=665912 RepID=M2TEU3_COCSN|nr:uncharacterized protein COCSADRAFT_292970 [Bipolaris sorokiniana ND90Pr]EMD67756.1 hypothetical protein COCSADRAFT_292970 [Bipolaris sorokiniana ND90Pr]
MFSWITGPRITNVIEDLQPENNYESTFIEPPETPAHQFAVKAFKHAIFGTPAPEDADDVSKKIERKAKIDAANAKAFVLSAPKENGPPISPSKQPGGILMTPGTASKGRKQVSFGSQVVDNEGKRGNIGRSGIPNDCPGKFPSPWTPGTQLKLDPDSETRPRTRLTEALLDARTTTQPKSGQKPKARDDSDITIDLGAPRSESGKYWKEQYESYADKSEKEMKKVIAKQQLAKKFAMKKDGEVTELVAKLEQERKRYKQREMELEQQNKDLQERLRKAMSENMSSSIEIASLKSRLVVLEGSSTAPSSGFAPSKTPFEIYEDGAKDVSRPPLRGLDLDNSFAPSNNMASSTKENTSPMSRRVRRGTIPDTLNRSIVPSRFGTAEGETSALEKSPRRFEVTLEKALTSTQQEKPPKSPLKIHRSEPTKESHTPKSMAAIQPSSPLPMPSPPSDDLWLDVHNDSSIGQMDKMAMPISTGQPYTRPEWNPPPKKNRVSKLVSNDRKPEALQSQEKAVVSERSEQTAEPQRRRDGATQEATHISELEATSSQPKKEAKHNYNTSKDGALRSTDSSSRQPRTDPKIDDSKVTTRHAEGSTNVKNDRNQVRDRDPRKRLEERRKLRKQAATKC